MMHPAWSLPPGPNLPTDLIGAVATPAAARGIELARETLGALMTLAAPNFDDAQDHLRSL
ncbi:hypothetical protein H7K33_03280 [Mycobacterium paraense]|uniref:hypothetical protein n=1 Tax=Mycobacterium paraense TaxID=767916 RepID=UPI00114D6C4A|nr:hypothetical protein [Mycobacterium paraense]MCV7441239.1 hypothetical protein [Mycobacterium paraense]